MTKTFCFFNLVIFGTKQEILLILQSVPRPYLVQSPKLTLLFTSDRVEVGVVIKSVDLMI